MRHCLSTTICAPFIGRLGRDADSDAPSIKIRQPLAPIHNLDDDSLLNVFYFCRPHVPQEDENGRLHVGNLVGEHWWYKCVQVCQRWRYLILGSASYLRLALLYTRGTPIADMLLHSPPLPLIINHDYQNNDLTAEDEEGIILALQNRNRVRHISLRMPVPSLQKLAMAMDGEFPILEFLYIKPPALRVASFSLPQMFEAPQLRHLWLDYFIFPIGSPCLSSAVGLVTLFLRWTHTSTYIQPELFLRAISLLLHLQQLEIGFRSDVSSREIEGQLPHTPITTQVTLPNLRQFKFWGNSGYLETLLPHMTIPLLQDLSVHFFNQLTFSVPRLLQFVIATEYPRFSHARLLFYLEGVLMNLDNPPAGTGMARLTHFQASVVRRNLFQQVLSITRILNDLRPLFSSVADLSLEYREHPVLSGLHNEVNRTLWRELLGLFMNVETLRVCKGLVGEVSHSLGLDGERPLELLPELKELVCPTGSVDDKTFAPFIHDREVAGHPVKLIGEAFPVGRESDYTFVTSIGAIYVALDPDLAVVLGLRDEGWPGPSPL